MKLNHRTEPKKLTTTTPLHASLAWSTRLEGGGVTKSWVVGVGFFHTENNYSEYSKALPKKALSEYFVVAPFIMLSTHSDHKKQIDEALACREISPREARAASGFGRYNGAPRREILISPSVQQLIYQNK